MLGGRWKPLHYLLARFLFADAFGTCGADGRCVFKNDAALAGFSGQAAIELLSVASGQRAPLATVPLELPRGAGAGAWVCADGSALAPPPAAPCASWADLLPRHGCAAGGADCMLVVTLTSASLPAPLENVVLLAPPSAMLPLPPARVVASVAALPSPDGQSCAVDVSTDATALFVTLTTLASGRFSDNAFVLAKGARAALQFLAFDARADCDLLAATLRVEHVALYTGEGSAAIQR